MVRKSKNVKSTKNQDLEEVLKLSEETYKAEQVSREVDKYLRLIEKGECTKDSFNDLFFMSKEAESMLGIKRGKSDSEKNTKPEKKNADSEMKELMDVYGSDPRMLDYDNFATKGSEKALVKEFKSKAVKLLAEFMKIRNPSPEEEKEFADLEGMNFAEFEDEVKFQRAQLKFN